MATILPKGMLMNTPEIYAEIAAHDVVPPVKLRQFWNVYTTVARRLRDPTAYRLENFWWRVQGSDKRLLSGPQLSRLFEEFSDRPPFRPLHCPVNRNARPLTPGRHNTDRPSPRPEQPPKTYGGASRSGLDKHVDNESVVQDEHAIEDEDDTKDDIYGVSDAKDDGDKEKDGVENKSLVPSAQKPPPSHTILKKPRRASVLRPRPKARFASPAETKTRDGSSGTTVANSQRETAWGAKPASEAKAEDHRGPGMAAPVVLQERVPAAPQPTTAGPTTTDPPTTSHVVANRELDAASETKAENPRVPGMAPPMVRQGRTLAAPQFITTGPATTHPFVANRELEAKAENPQVVGMAPPMVRQGRVLEGPQLITDNPVAAVPPPNRPGTTDRQRSRPFVNDRPGMEGPQKPKGVPKGGIELSSKRPPPKTRSKDQPQGSQEMARPVPAQGTMASQLREHVEENLVGALFPFSPPPPPPPRPPLTSWQKERSKEEQDALPPPTPKQGEADKEEAAQCPGQPDSTEPGAGALTAPFAAKMKCRSDLVIRRKVVAAAPSKRRPVMPRRASRRSSGGSNSETSTEPTTRPPLPSPSWAKVNRRVPESGATSGARDTNLTPGPEAQPPTMQPSPDRNLRTQLVPLPNPLPARVPQPAEDDEGLIYLPPGGPRPAQAPASTSNQAPAARPAPLRRSQSNPEPRIPGALRALMASRTRPLSPSVATAVTAVPGEIVSGTTPLVSRPVQASSDPARNLYQPTAPLPTPPIRFGRSRSSLKIILETTNESAGSSPPPGSPKDSRPPPPTDPGPAA